MCNAGLTGNFRKYFGKSFAIEDFNNYFILVAIFLEIQTCH